jgi:hypothetical protein
LRVKSKIKNFNIAARVYRAETDEWQDLGTISSTKLGWWKVRNLFKVYLMGGIKKWLQS